MKKYILAIVLTAFIISPAVFGEEIENSPVVDPQDVIFRSSLTDIVHDLNNTADEYYDDRYYQEIDPNNMPLLKQIRLKLTNSYLYVTNRPKKETNNPSKLKFWGRKTASKQTEQEEENIETSKSDISEAINNAINDKSEETVALEGGVNAEKTDKQFMLDAENISFDDDTGDMLATGRPKLYIPPQNTVITADKMLYNEGGNILKAIGNVIVEKDGVPMGTDELEINMNEETLVLNKIRLSASNMIIESENAMQKDGLLILNKGNLKSDNSYIYHLTSKMAGPDFANMIPDPETETLFFGDPAKNKLSVNASYIEINARKNHDVIKAKDIKFSHNDKVFFKWPTITMYTNKQHNYFEGNYPEFGSRRKLGVFAGPGFAFGGPFSSVIKVIPFVNYRSSKWGIGGMLKYMNTYNRTELGYGSAKNIFFVKGKQRLDDNLFLQYAYNSYTDEWFLGGRMPKYIAELYFDKSYPNKNFLGEGKDLTFRQRAGFGFMKDDNKSYNSEHFNDETNMSTTRTRYMAELNQTLYSYKNIEKRINVNFSTVLQGSAAIYGTGDTQFIARFGPMLRLQYKNWMQDVTYYLTGYDDHTPLQHYDTYRYGRSSIRITEAFKLSRYLSVGWSGYLNLSDDAPNGKMFQENAFILSVGPDDFKVVLGYDFIRDRTYFGVNVAFDPKGTDVRYDKLVIKNPERLGKSNGENERQIAFATTHKNEAEDIKDKRFLRPAPEQKTKVLEYATVIDLEDPEKERID